MAAKKIEKPWGRGVRTVPADHRPLWRRYDVQAGLTLHDAMIYYGPEFEARTVWELEMEGFGDGQPMMLDVSGWPDKEAEREYRIKSFRLERCRRFLQVKLLLKLRIGVLYAVGYDQNTPLDRNAPRIAADRWRILKPNFETSEATSAVAIVAGLLVFDPSASPTMRPEASFSEATVRAWYQLWIRENCSAGFTSSRDDDWRAAKAKFQRPLPRRLLRELRRELAPAEWTKLGRRKNKS